MTVLSGHCGDIVLASPGLYVIASQGITLNDRREATSLFPREKSAEGEEVTEEGLVGFLVAPLGDFVVSRLVPAEPGLRVTVNGRRPLGGLERLDDEDVIGVRPVAGFGVNRSDPIRFTYFRRKGPPIRFVLPVTSNLHCSYSGRRLAGVTAVRCSGCFLLYHEEAAWRSDLDEMCPACGWSSQQETRHD